MIQNEFRKTKLKIKKILINLKKKNEEVAFTLSRFDGFSLQVQLTKCAHVEGKVEVR
jgi:hypothetical protein